MIDNQRITPRLSEKGSKQQAKKASQAGFTLVELLVVIGILGIMMSIAGGSWTKARADEQVRSAAEKIRSAMTAARMKALTTGKSQCVGIDNANDAITSSIWEQDGQVFCLMTGATVDSYTSATVWESTDNVNLSGYAITTNTISTADANGIRWFVFTARGTATGKSVLVQSNDTTSSYAMSITVGGVTGRVRMQEQRIVQ